MTSPMAGVQSIAIGMSVHLFAGISQKPHVQTLKKFLCTSTMAVALPSSYNNVVTFGFVDSIRI